jgi:hypothetical protein
MPRSPQTKKTAQSRGGDERKSSESSNDFMHIHGLRMR